MMLLFTVSRTFHATFFMCNVINSLIYQNVSFFIVQEAIKARSTDPPAASSEYLGVRITPEPGECEWSFKGHC